MEFLDLLEKNKRQTGWADNYVDFRTWCQEVEDGREEAALVEAMDNAMEKLSEFTASQWEEIQRSAEEILIQVELQLKTLEDRVEAARSIDALQERFLQLEEFVNLHFLGFSEAYKHLDNTRATTTRPSQLEKLSDQFWVSHDCAKLLQLLQNLKHAVESNENNVYLSPYVSVNLPKSRKSFLVPKHYVGDVMDSILVHLPKHKQDKGGVVSALQGQSQICSTVYFDNVQLEAFHARILGKPASFSIRLRWYATTKPELVYVEKVYYSSSAGTVVRESFTIRHDYVQPFLRGEYTVEDRLAEMKVAGQSTHEQERVERLFRQVQQQIASKCLRPVLRTIYKRVQFDTSSMPSVRLSVDSLITMIKEDPEIDGRAAVGCRWFTPLESEEELAANLDFEYALLNIDHVYHADDQPPLFPPWLYKVTERLHHVAGFSKFVHGCSILHRDEAQRLPSWVTQERLQTNSSYSSNYAKSLTHLSHALQQSPWDASSPPPPSASTSSASPTSPYDDMPFSSGAVNVGKVNRTLLTKTLSKSSLKGGSTGKGKKKLQFLFRSSRTLPRTHVFATFLNRSPSSPGSAQPPPPARSSSTNPGVVCTNPLSPVGTTGSPRVRFAMGQLPHKEQKEQKEKKEDGSLLLRLSRRSKRSSKRSSKGSSVSKTSSTPSSPHVGGELSDVGFSTDDGGTERSSKRKRKHIDLSCVSVEWLAKISKKLTAGKLAKKVQLYVVTRDTTDAERSMQLKRGTTVQLVDGENADTNEVFVRVRLPFLPNQGVLVEWDCLKFKPREEWSLEDVCVHFVRTETVPKKKCFVDLLRSRHPHMVSDKPCQGSYVIASRSTTFAALCNALGQHAKLHADQPHAKFFWLDIFGMNQAWFDALETGKAPVDRLQQFIRNGMAQALGRFDNVVLCLEPNHKAESHLPLPLNRRWCLWELYNAQQDLKVVFTTDSGKAGADAKFANLLQNASASISLLDIRSSSCRRKQDADFIEAEVSRMEGGHDAVNATIKKKLARWLTRHLESSAKRLQNVMGETGLSTKDRVCACGLLLKVSKSLQEKGEIEQALSLALKCAEFVREEKVPTKVFVSVFNQTGTLYSSIGEYDSAAAYHDKVLSMLTKDEGSRKSDDLAFTLKQLGVALQGQGRYEEAKRTELEALELLKENEGQRLENTAHSLNHLGEVLASLGRWEEAMDKFTRAVDLYNQVLSIYQVRYGGWDIRLADILICLANTYHNTGNLTAAQHAFEAALEIKLDSLGPGHEDVAEVHCKLGGIHFAQGKFDDALRCYTEALGIFKEAFGPEDVRVAQMFDHIGVVLTSMSRLEDALSWYQQAKDIFEQRMDMENPLVGDFLFHIGSVLVSQGSLDEALENLDHALRIYIRSFGESNEKVADTLERLAVVFEKQGNVSQAIEFQSDALDIRLKIFGKSHPRTYQALHALHALKDLKARSRAWSSDSDSSDEEESVGLRASIASRRTKHHSASPKSRTTASEEEEEDEQEGEEEEEKDRVDSDDAESEHLRLNIVGSPPIPPSKYVPDLPAPPPLPTISTENPLSSFNLQGIQGQGEEVPTEEVRKSQRKSARKSLRMCSDGEEDTEDQEQVGIKPLNPAEARRRSSAGPAVRRTSSSSKRSSLRRSSKASSMPSSPPSPLFPSNPDSWNDFL